MRCLAGICWAVLAFGNAGAHEMTADERQIAAEFSAMAAVAGPLGITFRTVVVDDVRDGDTPLALGYEDGTCTLVVQVRDNALYKALVLARDGRPKEVKLRAILAHEMGHCFRHYFDNAPAGNADAPAVSARAHLRERHESEVQADRFALAWTAIYRPEEYDDVLAYLRTLRSSLCVDRSGTYARVQELDTGKPPATADRRSDTELLVEIATERRDTISAGGPPLR